MGVTLCSKLIEPLPAAAESTAYSRNLPHSDTSASSEAGGIGEAPGQNATDSHCSYPSLCVF